MEQQIRFCTTSDGVRIAYATVGQGPPFVFVPGWISHLELDWEPLFFRQWWESLAQHFTVVRFDKRGSGLSDKGFAEYSVDAWVSDLEAVTEHLGLRELALEGMSEGGPVAITYAARHPQRVSKLILHGTFSGAEGRRDDLVDALVRLVQAEWGLGSETMTNLFMADASPEMKAWFTRHQREGTTREDAIAMLRALPGIDVSQLLPQIAAPTLVVHGRQDQAVPFEWARKLTSSIPNARLFPFEGGHVATDPDILSHVGEVIMEFLSEGVEPEAPTASPSGLFTILFTDIENSAALRQRLGDAEAQDLVHVHNAIVRDALKSHQGKEIKHTGDGIMSSFSTASSAIEAAITIQRGIVAHVQEHPDAPLGVYVGLNAGEPIAEEQDLFGTSVDLARRICDHAQPAQILVSDVVRQLAAGKDFLFSDCGETEMRGFEDPVRLYEVRWREDG